MKLTALEAEELFIVAINGYGDGEYYQNRNQPKQHAAFCRALEKLRIEMQRLAALERGKGE